MPQPPLPCLSITTTSAPPSFINTTTTMSSVASPSSWDSRISPSIILVIAIVAIIFFLSALLHLLIRYLFTPTATTHLHPSPTSSPDATALQGQLQHLFHLHDSGVDQSFIDTLPVFLYRSITTTTDGNKKRSSSPFLHDPFDCAVCLCEFQPDDKLRLLPNCSHAFHIQCIDTWLLSHSTCPLCRSSLLLLTDHHLRYYYCDEDDDNSHVGSLHDDEKVDPSTTHRDSGRGVEGGEEEKVMPLKLGKYRTTTHVDGEGSSNNNNNNNDGNGNGNDNSSSIDGRRCFSMGSFEYVVNESWVLQVAVKKRRPTRRRRRMAVSECGESKARDRKGKASLDCRSEVGGYGDVESCEDGMSVVSGGGALVRRGEEAPSFARRTMLWVMGRNPMIPTNKVGDHAV